MTQAHISVLLHETIDGLAIRPDGTYIDGTFGRGGHSRQILQRLGANGRLFAIDRDPSAIAAAQASEFAGDPRFHISHCAFAAMVQVAQAQGISGQVDGILLDLGVSSPQLDDAERGFSFMRDGPLDMRMDPTSGISAAAWLAKADADDIAFVLREYGEEKFAWKIAKTIVERRDNEPLTRTAQLASLIASVVPKSPKEKKHPATRSFQGIRIYINSELEQVATALEAALDILKPGGRLSVISFHSLEDRLVKQFMRKHSKPAPLPKGIVLTDAQMKQDLALTLVGKAIMPSDDELAQNPRARSAVLRVAERTAMPKREAK